MSENTIKYKVTVDAQQARRAIKMTSADLDQLSQRAAKAMKAASTQTNAFSTAAGSASVVVGGLSTAVTRASAAIALFHRAMGIFGAISSIIMGAVALWRAYRDRTERATAAQAEANKKLSEARKKVEELNQARLDRAQKAMRGFADEIARARDNANALSSAIGDLASAQADFDAAQVDLAVSRGEMSKEEGEKAKAGIAVDAAVAARKADTDQKLENLQAARTVVDNFKTMHPDMVVGEDGRVDITDNDFYRKYSDAQTQANIHAKDPDADKYKHEAEIARQNWVAFMETAREYENALAALEVATKEYDAALLKGDAVINRAVAAQEKQALESDKATKEAHEKSARELAKANVDWEVQQGGKSAKAGELEKRRIDLEAERDAVQNAIFDRTMADQKEGRDPKTDDVLDTLWNNLATLERKLEIVDDQARKEEEGEGKEEKAPEMVRPSVDAWTRIGAFAGGGAQTDSLNIQRNSLTALKAIQKSSERMQQALTIMKPLTL